MAVNKSKGDMYTWVSHTWSPITGCSHQCTYCYVPTYRILPEIPVLNEKDFPPLGKDRKIFVGHMCDMFCEATPDAYVLKVLEHCRKFDNAYVFQTKNLTKLLRFEHLLPLKRIIGTTIETNRADVLANISKAPSPQERAEIFQHLIETKFITIEPILDFDLNEFADMIIDSGATFVNIGADSKGHNLPEPPRDKLAAFISALQAAGVVIRKKINLGRILNT